MRYLTDISRADVAIAISLASFRGQATDTARRLPWTWSCHMMRGPSRIRPGLREEQRLKPRSLRVQSNALMCPFHLFAPAMPAFNQFGPVMRMSNQVGHQKIDPTTVFDDRGEIELKVYCSPSLDNDAQTISLSFRA